MFSFQRKQQDLDHQNQDQRCDRERVDTEVKLEIPGMPAFSTPSKNMSPPQKASKQQQQQQDPDLHSKTSLLPFHQQPSPCSSGKSASSELGSLWNKGSVSSKTQSRTAELAATSKTPHRGEAPLASRLPHEKFHSKHRSEHVKDRELNRSTHGEVSGGCQSRGILKSSSEMKHLFRKTNTEKITDSERLSSAETPDVFLGGSAALLHVPTFEKLPRQSEEEEEEEKEEEEADVDLCCSWEDILRKPTFPLSVSHPSLAAGGFCHTLHSPWSPNSPLFPSVDSAVSGDGYSLSPLPEQIWEPRVPPITKRIHRGAEARTRQTCPLPKRHRSWKTSLTGSFGHRQSAEVDTKEDHGCPAYDLWSTKEPWRQSASGQPDSVHVSGVFGDIKERVRLQEFPAAGGAAAAQSARDPEDSRLIVCRPKQRLLKAEEEKEEDQCRICHSGEDLPENGLISPCLCSGSMKFIHLQCLMTWIKTKIESGSRLITECELCKGTYRLEPQNIDLSRFFLEHQKKTDRPRQRNRVRNLEDVAGVLHFGTFISRGLEPQMIPRPRPVWMWQSFPLLMRMRLRRIRERRNPSPESPDV